jgi:hypothetical protein
MPNYTYQIYLKYDGLETREYVCAEDRMSAVNQFLEENPYLSIDFLLQSEQIEVERCA